MARGIANTEKDRFMLFFGMCKRFFLPGVPVDRIVGMLEQVGTFLIYEGVWRFLFLFLACMQSHPFILVCTR
jgi:hypothetical protein